MGVDGKTQATQQKIPNIVFFILYGMPLGKDKSQSTGSHHRPIT
jgi:hypothetical protein